MNKKPEVKSIAPKPDKEMCELIVRLKVNPDFVKFREVLIKGRAGGLAILSCSPQFDDRFSHYIQGRVHELSDLERTIENIEEAIKEYKSTEVIEGGM